MAYNSAYKGSQVDAAVGAVLEKETVWDGKQDKLTFDSVPTPESSNPVTSNGIASALGGKQDKLSGTSGQVVGFDESGNAVAQEAPQAGLMQEAADQRYLKLSGGTVTGDVAFQGDYLTVHSGGIRLDYPGHGGGVLYADNENTDRLVFFNLDETGPVVVGGIDTPVADDDTANKSYVDTTVSTKADKPKSVSVTLTAAGWDSATKKQTVSVAGVLADGSKQFVSPYAADEDSLYAYGNASVRCFEWAANSMTFICDTVPDSDINLIVKLEGAG